MAVTLYKRQRQIVDYVAQYIQKNGFSPTLKEIAISLNVSSLATVHEHLQALERKNVIKRHEGTVRGIELVDRTFLRVTDSIDLPILGFIAAGSPIEPYTDPDATFKVSPEMVSGKKRSYILQVKGQSMIEDHIDDGDYVVIEETQDVNNGDIVVLSSSGALLYEDTTTISSSYSKTPTIDTTGNLYIFDENGILYSFNPDLSIRWQRTFTLPSGYATNSSYSALSVAIGSDGTLYFYDGRYLKALYPSDGSGKWSYDIVGAPPATIVYSSPSIASDGTIYAVSEGCIRAINPNNSLKWQNCVGNF